MEKSTNKAAQQEAEGKNKTVIRKQFTLGYKGRKGDIQGGISKTVPDMGLSVRQLLINHTRGIDTMGSPLQAQFFDEEIPVFLDLTDREAYRDSLIDRANEIEAQIALEQENAAEAAKMAQEAKQAAIDAAKNITPPEV